MTDAIKIDVWSDIACPWCYIGKRNLEKGLAEASGDADAPEVEVTFHSFELSPDTPVDFEGGEEEYLAQHKGISPDQAQQMLERVTGVAAGSGLDLPLRPSEAHEHGEGARAAALREGARPPGRDRRAAHVGVLHRGPPPRPRGRAGRSRRRRRARCGCRPRGAAQRDGIFPPCAPIRSRLRPTASTACRSSSSTGSTASPEHSPRRPSRRSSVRCGRSTARARRSDDSSGAGSARSNDTICGSSGFILGRKRLTWPSGSTRNFSKFHSTRPALPSRLRPS